MLSLAASFALLLTGIRDAIAPVAARDWARTAFLVFIHQRLRRSAARFERLYARWKAGTLPKPRTTPRAPRTAAATTRTRKPVLFRLPSRRFWLLHQNIPGAASRASQFRHLLATHPELPEFLAAAPQAARILNPICRMLGVALPVTQAAAPPKAAANPEPTPAQAPRRPRPAEPRQPTAPTILPELFSTA